MKIRVLEVIRQGEVGGGESHLIDLVMGLQAQEDMESVVLSFTDGPMIHLLREKGVNCHVILTSTAFDVRVMSEVKEVVKSEQIDLIHAHGSRAASNMLLVSQRMGVPMIYTVHGWSFHEGMGKLIYKLRVWSERLICRFSERVICVSESNYRTGQEAFGLKKGKCEVIENGVDLHRFDASATYPDLRTELGFSKDDFVVAFICRITSQKGPMDFVRAVEQAHQRVPRIKALMVGEGDMAEEVDSYIKEHACEDYLVRQPFRSDVPALLAASDVFCLPSLWEGLSIAMLEAMAMHKAMVVTMTDGARDLIHHGHNALVVPPQNPEALADAFVKAESDPELCRLMGRRGGQLVKQRFDAARVAERVGAIYRELCESSISTQP